jgi:small nuclear ribonucleoprotein F
MSFVPINPRPFLQGLIGNYIYVRLKWGETEYKGKLVSTDSYMNIQLSDAEEHIPDQEATKLGQILIRCNNVLWIRGAGPRGGNEKDVTMED